MDKKGYKPRRGGGTQPGYKRPAFITHLFAVLHVLRGAVTPSLFTETPLAQPATKDISAQAALTQKIQYPIVTPPSCSPLLGRLCVKTSTPCTLEISIGIFLISRSRSDTESVGSVAFASAESSFAWASFSSFVDSITFSRSFSCLSSLTSWDTGRHMLGMHCMRSGAFTNRRSYIHAGRDGFHRDVPDCLIIVGHRSSSTSSTPRSACRPNTFAHRDTSRLTVPTLFVNTTNHTEQGKVQMIENKTQTPIQSKQNLE